MLGVSENDTGKVVEDFRRDCLARHWLNGLKSGRLSRDYIEEQLTRKGHSEDYTADMRRRLNEQRKLMKRGQKT